MISILIYHRNIYELYHDLNIDRPQKENRCLSYEWKWCHSNKYPYVHGDLEADPGILEADGVGVEETIFICVLGGV